MILAPVDRTDAGASSKQAVRPYIWSLVFGLALVLTVSLSWILYSKNQSSPKIRSLAVLPLENLSGDASQDYFADGMTDQLIASLGQISALRVISRTSVMTYKGVRKPLAQIARELNVDAVVEGSVLRSGDQVRITRAVDPGICRQAHLGPELTKGRSGTHWCSKTG